MKRYSYTAHADALCPLVAPSGVVLATSVEHAYGQAFLAALGIDSLGRLEDRPNPFPQLLIKILDNGVWHRRRVTTKLHLSLSAEVPLETVRL